MVNESKYMFIIFDNEFLPTVNKWKKLLSNNGKGFIKKRIQELIKSDLANLEDLENQQKENING